MTADPSVLPKEVAVLVHHIELNRSGWWDKVIQRLALAAVWWSDHPPSVDEIKQTLSQQFKLLLSHEKLRAVQIQKLLALDAKRRRIAAIPAHHGFTHKRLVGWQPCFMCWSMARAAR